MKIAIVAPSPVPFTIGGAEKLWWGLLREINGNTCHQAELIKVPTRELTFWDLIDSYEAFSQLDLSYFDLVISTKYPAWMVSHPRHICYMQHRLRGLYDCYHFNNLPPRYETDHPDLLAVQRLLRRWPSGSGLQEVFDRLRNLRYQEDIPSAAFQFPGSFIKQVVEYFDGVGLQSDAIQKYYAISQTVANRRSYFPRCAAVEVLNHPSNLEEFHCRDFNYLFTASRLDNPKRIALLIEAMRFVKSKVELRIAGEGPNAQRLKELANGDPRVIFLGYRSDTQLIEDYANALAVAFIPYDEDYGLITVEAMMSRKPVLTVTDSGGPTEFVMQGKTGLCVAPDPRAIGEAIDWFAEHPTEAALLGENAFRRVRSITWQNTVNKLLTVSGHVPGGANKLRVTVAVTFSITPVRNGGQARIFHLFKNLAPQIQSEIITLGQETDEAFSHEVSPGLRETRIPKSKAHCQAEAEISREVEWFPVTDVVFPQLAHLTPDYLRALERSCRDADVVVASHPYVLQAIEIVSDKPIWYEAQDVEYLLKKEVIPKTARGLALIDQVLEVERRCCEKATMVMACSEVDARELIRLYNFSEAKVRVVPNGVDTRKVRFRSREQCFESKRELGLEECFSAVFIGSWHEPNLRAIKTIMKMAEECPDVQFLILGSSCMAFEKQIKPDNVGLLGVVDDETKDLVLRTADIALNPVQQGSGTNLKMLEYAAAGIPIVTTALGMRGLGFQHLQDVFVEEIGDFPERIASTQSAPLGTLQEMTERARRHVTKYFDWRGISRRLLASL